MRSALTVCLLLTCAAAMASQPARIRITVKNDPQHFLDDVGRLCLSSPEARIEPAGASAFLINETSDICAREIESFATQWDREPAVKTVAVYARAEQKAQLEKKLREQFPEDLKIHTGQACPCVVLRGSRAQDAAKFALK